MLTGDVWMLKSNVKRECNQCYNVIKNKLENQMSNRRKQLHQHKMKKVLNQHSSILLYQHSGLTTKRWKQLRESLVELEQTPTSASIKEQPAVQRSAVAIFIKDRLARLASDPSLCKTHKAEKQVAQKGTIYQGPMLLIGCNSHAHMVLAHNALVKQAEQNRYSLLLVGGSYHRTRLTHKDVQRLIKLDQSVYTSLLNVIEGASIGFVHQLMSSQHSLLSVFTALKLKADQTTYLN